MINFLIRYGKYIAGFVAIYIFVLLSVALSGFPNWEFKGPFTINPSEYPFLVCLVISSLVFFVTVMLFDSLQIRPFVGTSAINGFAYNSTILNWVSQGTQVKSKSAGIENSLYFERSGNVFGNFYLQEISVVEPMIDSVFRIPLDDLALYLSIFGASLGGAFSLIAVRMHRHDEKRERLKLKLMAMNEGVKALSDIDESDSYSARSDLDLIEKLLYRDKILMRSLIQIHNLEISQEELNEIIKSEELFYLRLISEYTDRPPIRFSDK